MLKYHLIIILSLIKLLEIAANKEDSRTTRRSDVLPDKVICPETLELVFLLDDSDSAVQFPFDDVLYLAQVISDQFSLGQSKTRVAAATFSDKLNPKFFLTDFNTAGEIRDAIRAIQPSPGRGRKTNEAIQYARLTLFGRSRPGVSKALVILTHDEPDNVSGTIDEAKLAEKERIAIFVVGLGARGNRLGVQDVASKPSDDYFVHVPSFARLETGASQLNKQICHWAVKHGGTVATTLAATEPAAGRECSRIADLVFLVDDSSNPSPSTYSRLLEVMKRVTEHFGVGDSGTRVGVVSYSSGVKLVSALDHHNDKEQINQIIGTMKQTNSKDSHLENALDYVREKVFQTDNPRRGFKRILVILTGSSPTTLAESKKQAELLEREGVTLVVVGPSQLAELKEIASEPKEKNFFPLSDKDPGNIKDQLSNHLCEVAGYKITITMPTTTTESVTTTTKSTTPPRRLCAIRLELVFLLANTGIMGLSDFDIVRNFVLDIVSMFDVSHDRTRIGLATYSDQPYIWSPLQQHNDLVLIRQAMDRITLTSSASPNLALALRQIRMETFAFGRKGVRSTLIIVTPCPPLDLYQARHEASLLYNSGVHVMVVGVGDQPSVTSLRDLARTPDDCFFVNYANGLPGLSSSLGRQMCVDSEGGRGMVAIPSRTYSACPESRMEVIFLIDRSNSIWGPDFDRQKRLVCNLIDYFTIGPYLTRAAVISFSSRPTLQFHLNWQKERMKDQVMRLFQTGQAFTTDTWRALDMARTDVLSAARPGASRIVFVLTDGSSHDDAKTETAARRLQETGALVFAIGFGDNVNYAGLECIASSPSSNHVLAFRKNDDTDVSAKLINILCSIL